MTSRAGEKYSDPWDCCGWGRLWETKTNTPLIATKGKRKSYSLDKPKGNSFVPGISSAVLKLLNTTQRLSREGQQQNERNKKGEGRWEKKTTGGRWMEEREMWEVTKKVARVSQGVLWSQKPSKGWKAAGKSNFYTDCYICCKEARLTQSNSMTLRTNQWPFLGFHFQSSNTMWFLIMLKSSPINQEEPLKTQELLVAGLSYSTIQKLTKQVSQQVGGWQKWTNISQQISKTHPQGVRPWWNLWQNIVGLGYKNSPGAFRFVRRLLQPIRRLYFLLPG